MATGRPGGGRGQSSAKLEQRKYPGGIFCADILEGEKAFGERFFSFGA